MAQVAVEAEAEHLKAAKSTWDFLSRATLLTSTIASQVERPEAPAAQRRGPRDYLTVLDHDLFHFPSLGVWRCKACNASARTDSTLKGLRSGAGRACNPTNIQKWRAHQFSTENSGPSRTARNCPCRFLRSPRMPPLASILQV